MTYDKACYERRKLGRIRKAMDPNSSEGMAFQKIRDMWGFTDLKISKLLKTNTVTEILQGEMIGKIFHPKELIRFTFYCLLTITIALSAYIGFWYGFSKMPMKMSFINNLSEIGNSVLK